ncbi:MAG: hypothetical protein FK733_07655 [Asgard group archaeon]|nr:hypothetical protein [Asgard group archaeon]
MKFKKGIVASIIIITIAILAFGAGFLKERVVTQIEGIKTSITEDEFQIDKIGSKISDILTLNYLTIDNANDEKKVYSDLCWEFDAYYDNLTPADIFLYRGRITTSINTRENIIRNSIFGDVINHFDRDANESDYFFAIENPDGYNFSITKEAFTDFNNSYGLYMILPANIFLNSIRNASYWKPLLLPNVHEEFTIINNTDAWASLYRTAQSEIQDGITSNTELLTKLESIVSYYSYGVTLITVATILATAMSAKLSDKEREKEFFVIKSAIDKKEEFDQTKDFEKPKENKFAIPVLIVALVLSALGLVVPLLYGVIF